VDVSDAELPFVATITNDGIPAASHPLIPNDADIFVTNDNLDEYIRLYYLYVLGEPVKGPFQAFRSGFVEFVAWKKDRSLIDYFCYDELDRLLSGDDIMDWKDSKETAQYTERYSRRGLSG
jgi:hypothetical protein